MPITTNIYDSSYDAIHMARKILPQNQSVTTTTATNTSSIPNTQIYDTQTAYKPIATPLATILQLLLDSKFEFHLGGSRAMFKRGAQFSINEDNDYDFYATFSLETTSFLKDNGFKPAIDYYTNDSECIAVYIRDNVKVVLRKDAKFYKGVFDNIPVDLYMKHLWRRNPTCKVEMITPLFNEMFKLAHEKEQNLTKTKVECVTPIKLDDEFSHHNTENIPF